MNETTPNRKSLIQDSEPIPLVFVLKKALKTTFSVTLFLAFLLVAFTGYFIIVAVREFSEVQFSDEAAAKASSLLVVKQNSPYQVEQTANLPGFQVVLFRAVQPDKTGPVRGEDFQVYGGIDLAFINRYCISGLKGFEFLGNSIERLTDPEDPEVLTIERADIIEHGSLTSTGQALPYQVINLTYRIENRSPKIVSFFMGDITSSSGKKALVVLSAQPEELDKSEILTFLRYVAFQ